ncbi:MAG TPA: translation initiation factor IF-3 [Spirochaetota bacterium]|nr:translation initiation factor IF-3 [Spirochaetota bacterium]
MLESGRRFRIEKSDLKRYRINDQIREPMVRLVGEEGGARVIPTEEAMTVARAKDMDLVEISPDQDPPVVKIIDFSKFRFEQIKKAKEAKKKQKVIHVKEVKFRPAIDSHDYRHKVNHARAFLGKGDKVKFTLMFRGREIVHNELGFKVMDNIRKDLEEVAQVEKKASIEGRNITMIMTPIPSTAKK